VLKAIQIPAWAIVAFITFFLLSAAVNALEKRLDYGDALGFVIATILAWQLWSGRNRVQEDGRDV
jgi:hypothetical protein